jgi:hypothetical protein
MSNDVTLPAEVEAAIAGLGTGLYIARTLDDVRRIAHLAMAEALDWAMRHENGAGMDWDSMDEREAQHRLAAKEIA